MNCFDVVTEHIDRQNLPHYSLVTYLVINLSVGLEYRLFDREVGRTCKIHQTINDPKKPLR